MVASSFHHHHYYYYYYHYYYSIAIIIIITISSFITIIVTIVKHFVTCYLFSLEGIKNIFMIFHQHFDYFLIYIRLL